jgi:hypothetical protein
VSLEDLGNLGDFIGGIAVVVTLVYLALQIRQNTRALQASSRQSLASGFRAFNRLAWEVHPPGLLRDGLQRVRELSDRELGVFQAVMTDQALSIQEGLALFDAGMLDEQTWEAYLRFFASTLSTPGGAAWWEEIRNVFPPHMIAAVEERLARGDVPDLFQNRYFGKRPESEG